ncbi:MAG: efflux transporter outer membrane subunit [Marinifilaceae bacterium]|nr:efflux transporter outer membrane subunit [Marinifilaceae bacterium]
MKSSYIILALSLLWVGSMSSCNIYRKYQRPEVVVNGLYRDVTSDTDTLKSDTANMGNLPWKEMFTDPKLQALIEEGLANNLDLQTAALRVKEYEAQLLSARLAYLPSFNLTPTGTVASFDNSKATQTYQLPVAASWEVDLFGRLLNSKRAAKAALLQSEWYRQAVQTQVVAAIANGYYTLLMLDAQLSLSEETAKSWAESVRTTRALKDAALTTQAAVSQSEAQYNAVEISIVELRQQIREAENALCLLLGRPAGAVERGMLDEQDISAELSAGVPVQLLSNRPDVRQAEAALMVVFANTNVARSAFYPQLTLSGTAGWTNSVGSQVLNPGKLILSATAGLVQPIFNKGANTAKLRVAKAQQEEARLAFQKSLLNAGNEVSNALYQYKTVQDKKLSREEQIFSLEAAVKETEELQRLSTTTYLEVLTARQTLLSARLSQVADAFQELQAMVNLYQALGGGRY